VFIVDQPQQEVQETYKSSTDAEFAGFFYTTHGNALCVARLCCSKCKRGPKGPRVSEGWIGYESALWPLRGPLPLKAYKGPWPSGP